MCEDMGKGKKKEKGKEKKEEEEQGCLYLSIPLSHQKRKPGVLEEEKEGQRERF